MQIPSIFQPFWNDFLRTVADADDARARFYEICRFGRTDDNADKTAALIVSGEKTTTSALAHEFEVTGKPLPRPGALTLFLDGRSRAAGIIETVSVRIVPFSAVDSGFVHDYGEGDRSLDFWHTTIWGYYVEDCARLGARPSPNMPLVCERFRLVFPEPAVPRRQSADCS